jgi:DHA2 family methylenomycin A resistance protein-like MFS transporter
MLLTSLCLGWFVVIVDATIVNVALPEMGRHLHASVSDLQWVLDGYTVVFAGLLLSGGWLSDRFGARRVFAWGLAVFGAASAGCALAPGLGALIATRVVQGAGAALLVPGCLNLIQTHYRDPVARARAIGVWGTVGGLAGGSGPLLGGVLTATLGWRALFWVNVPVAALALFLTRRYVPAGDRSGAHRLGFDVTGQLTGAAALLGLTAAVVEAGRVGWLRPLPITLLVGGTGATLAFLLAQRYARHPMLPYTLFASRQLSIATIVGFLMNFAFYGMLFVETIVLARRYGFGALGTGLALLPQTATIALGSWCGGRVTARTGPRLPMAVGMASGTLGFFLLTLAGSAVPYGVLVPGMVAAGFGISFCMPAATFAVVDAAPAGRGGTAAGVLNASRQVGGALGIALLGSFVAGGSAAGSGGTGWVWGARVAAVVAGCTYLTGLILSLRLRRQPRSV